MSNLSFSHKINSSENTYKYIKPAEKLNVPQKENPQKNNKISFVNKKDTHFPETLLLTEIFSKRTCHVIMQKIFRIIYHGYNISSWQPTCPPTKMCVSVKIIWLQVTELDPD